MGGCSEPTASPRSTPAAPPSIDCENASQVDWEKYRASLTPEGDASEGPPEPLPFNEPFDYSPVNADAQPTTDLKVTLTKMTCGLKSLPEADSNPKWDGSADIPEYIDAKPEEGKDFCVIYWSWKNVGKSPGGIDQSGDLMIGDERHSRDSEDEMRSWTLMENELGVDYTDDMNPGESTKSLDVYQVPTGKAPDAVWFPMTTMVSESWLLISTR
jgi:hypothetical protein